jgi:hypothetical protein
MEQVLVQAPAGAIVFVQRAGSKCSQNGGPRVSNGATQETCRPVVPVLSTLNLISVDHPKGHAMICCCIEDDIYEVQSFNSYDGDVFGSWFINQRVSSQKKFFMASKMDPRFLLLPSLHKNGTRFSPLDQIVVCDSACSKISLESAPAWRMDDFCDVNSKFEDMVLYRYNEDKVKTWLLAKVSRAAKTLMKQRHSRLLSSNLLMSSSFNVSKQTKSHSATDATQGEGRLLCLHTSSLTFDPCRNSC